MGAPQSSTTELPTLARLGADTEHYAQRDYSRTQLIAEAAFFLGFDGLIAPSARWRCLNLVLFTERLAPDQIAIESSEAAPIDWDAWSRGSRA
jgi:RES domain